MKRQSLFKHITRLTYTFSLSVMAAVASADEQVPPFFNQPFERDLSAYVEFSDAETFTPPEALPRMEYDKSVEMAPARRAFDLTAVAITPEGEAFKAEVDSADLQLFENALDWISDSFEGVRRGDTLEGELNLNGEEANETPEDLGPENVIPPDERIQITDTSKYPYRVIGRIDIGCTGTLIGPRHVLTAGHCVYDTSTDKWYNKLDFSPGQNGSSRPYGKIGWGKAITVKGWTKSHSWNYDYAMIVLAKPIGSSIGWLGYGYKNGQWTMNLNVNGYPADKPFGTMWHAFCGVTTIDNYRVKHRCDTYGGMSGSGLYLYKNGHRIIYAVHAYGGSSYNSGTRINSAVFTNLKNWKAQNP